MNKKQLYINIFLIIISVALIFTLLFVPLVHIIPKTFDNERNIIENAVGIYSLTNYTKSGIFLFTDASDFYFGGAGPTWLSVFGILLNYLFIFILILFIAILTFNLITIKKDNLSIKNSIFSKKIGLIVGYFGIFVSIFEFTSFLLTTMLSNGYIEIYPKIQCYFTLFFSILILILTYLLNKRKLIQEQNKSKNIIGFSLSGLFSLLFIIFCFLPQYTIWLGVFAENSSFWRVMSNPELTTDLIYNGGDFAVGLNCICFYCMIIIMLFILIYSLIGVIRAVKNKSTNWLSGRVKRWSMSFLIFGIIYYCLIFATISVLTSEIWYDNLSVFLPFAYFSILFIFLPYLSSCIIPFCKKVKSKDIQKN